MAYISEMLMTIFSTLFVVVMYLDLKCELKPNYDIRDMGIICRNIPVSDVIIGADYSSKPSRGLNARILKTMENINYLLIVISAIAAIASPGPATLAIAGSSMRNGRRFGLSMAAGVLTGSLIWSIAAAFGLAAILNTNVWVFESLRYCGAIYLLYLAFKSLRSAFSSSQICLPENQSESYSLSYYRGLLIHLTNPKAILFFGSLYSIGIPATANPIELISVILVVGCVSSTIFLGYAMLFSNASARRIYLKSKVIFESAFALIFGVAGFKLLTSDFGK